MNPIESAIAASHRRIEEAAAMAMEQVHLHASLARAQIKRMAEYQVRSAAARQGWETRRRNNNE